MIADIAEHAALGSSPGVTFTKLASRGASAPPPPLFLLGSSGRAVHEELFGQTEIGEAGTYTLKDAVVAPNGIAIKDGVAFNSVAFIHPAHLVETVAGRLLSSDLPERRIDGTLAVIYGPGHTTYGHWLVDFLPRLWVLAECGYDLSKLRYVVPPELTGVARKLLAHVGVRRAQLVPHRYWREMLRAETLLLPTGLRVHNRLSPLFAAATRFWTGHLRRSAPGADGTRRKLFVSRAHVTGARILDNRQRIEAIAGERGYAIVHPQTLPPGEQAAMFAGARIIAGEYGSGLHGSVYAAPGAVVVGLRGTARHPSFVQSGVAAALGQHCGYVLGETTLAEPGSDVAQVFCVCPEDFERALDIAEAAAEFRAA